MTLDCELPAYIGRRQPPLPVSGVMQIPMGSRVTVRAGAANKDLVRVQVGTLVDDRSAPLQTCSDGSDLAADHRGFSYALPPLMKDTTLLFTLTDTDGIEPRAGAAGVGALARPAAANGRATGRHRHGHHAAGPNAGRRPDHRRLRHRPGVVRARGRPAETGPPHDRRVPDRPRITPRISTRRRGAGGARVGLEAGPEAAW